MDQTTNGIPDHYRSATRTVLRYAIVMAIVGLLAGVAFQESAKKLEFDAVDPGLRIHATLHLALLHGHIFLMAVILPTLLAGSMFLARKAGGGEVGPRATAWLTKGYLPFATGTVILMLYKGYHFLLSARGGEADLAVIDANYFGGVAALRHGIYGVVHVGLSVSLVVFLIALWRTLGRK